MFCFHFPVSPAHLTRSHIHAVRWTPHNAVGTKFFPFIFMRNYNVRRQKQLPAIITFLCRNNEICSFFFSSSFTVIIQLKKNRVCYRIG